MNVLIKHKLSAFIVDNITKKGIFRLLADKQIIIIDFIITYGKMPNLQNPKTFNEKIQWFKLYGNLEKYAKYVDKLKVRDFVGKTIGQEYLVPLLGAWEKFEDIPFDKFPKKFVLKATHGSGYVFVCKDKAALNINALGKTVNKWTQENFYKKTREIQYKLCKPMIICEKYFEDESGGLIDYKFFCFDGKPHFIEVILDRFTGSGGHFTSDTMDLNWKKLAISYLGDQISKKILKKPQNLEKMIDVSKKLSKKFPFVRVDLYSVKNKTYFGELTFTPANGLDRFDPPEVDYQLGELIDLSKYKNQIIK